MIRMRSLVFGVTMFLIGCGATVDDIKEWEASGKEGVPKIIEALTDDDPFVRLAAVEALGRIETAYVVEPLVGALRDSDNMVRRAAARALGKKGDRRTVGPLIQALEDGDVFTRQAAAQALGKIADRRAVEPLTKVLKDMYHFLPVRIAAAGASGRIIGRPQASAVLMEAEKEYKLSLAYAAYKKAEVRDPEGAETYNNLAVVEFLQADLLSAESNFREAMRRNRNLVGTQMNLGVVFAASGELDSARVYFTKAQEKAGDILHAQIDYNLMWMYEEMERWTDALARYDSLMVNSQANSALKAKSYVCQGIVRAEQGGSGRSTVGISVSHRLGS